MAVYYFYDSAEPVPFNYLTPSRMVGQISPPYDTSMLPNDYLEYAIDDFADGSTRGLVNSFGNAKRALHLAIDIVLHQYGLFKYYGNKNFPAKLHVLNEIGIFPTNIIKNLNVERNLIEHEYDTPPKKRVGEAIDVVKLLLLVIEKLMEGTLHEAVIGWKSPKRHLILQLEPIHGIINLFTLKAKGNHRKSHGINHFCGRLRDFHGGKLLPGIEIAKSPWKTINLRKSDISIWKHILAELVNVQRKRSPHKMHIDKNSSTVTFSITVPMPTLKEKSLAQILDESIENRFKENEEKDKNAEQNHVDNSSSQEIEATN